MLTANIWTIEVWKNIHRTAVGGTLGEEINRSGLARPVGRGFRSRQFGSDDTRSWLLVFDLFELNCGHNSRMSSETLETDGDRSFPEEDPSRSIDADATVPDRTTAGRGCAVNPQRSLIPQFVDRKIRPRTLLEPSRSAPASFPSPMSV